MQTIFRLQCVCLCCVWCCLITENVLTNPVKCLFLSNDVDNRFRGKLEYCCYFEWYKRKPRSKCFTKSEMSLKRIFSKRNRNSDYYCALLCCCIAENSLNKHRKLNQSHSENNKLYKIHFPLSLFHFFFLFRNKKFIYLI